MITEDYPLLHEALEAIQEVFQYEPSGGYLHCIISDCNVESLPDIDDLEQLKVNPWTNKPVSSKCRKRYVRCIKALKRLSDDAREYVVSEACGSGDLWLSQHEERTGRDFLDSSEVK